MGELIHRLLERGSQKYPHAEALCDPAAGVRWTWQELYGHSLRGVQHLLAAGLRRGDRVILFMPNRPEYAVGLFAALRAGGVVVPVNARFTASELSHIVRDSEAAVILYDPGLEPVVNAALVLAASHARAIAAPALLAELDAALPLPADLDPADLAEIIYTSGTTGAPKGAMLTHNAVYAVCSMFAYEMEIHPEDRVLNLMPMTHSAVLNLTFLGAVYAGAASVIGNYTPVLLPQLVHQERCTHFFGAPVAFLFSAKLPNLAEFDLSSMKRWAYGGASMSREQVVAVKSRLGSNLVCVYGLTEAGPNGTLLTISEQDTHAGSIGRRGTVNTEVRIVRVDGTDVAPGEIGEIILRTPSMMQGYWRNPAATAETLRDGWVWTGDLAVHDEQGYMTVVDRRKDMIISGGVNVYPREVEEVLARHPAVEECAVFGVAHPEWGESVVAAVVLRSGVTVALAELEAHCAQHLARFKVPRHFQIRASLLRNSNGKILKHVMREEFVQG